MKETVISANLACRVYGTDVPECRWIGICEEQGISVQTGNLNELHSVFEEAMTMLIADLIEDGELDEFPKAREWNKRDMPSVKRQTEKRQPAISWSMPAELNSNARPKAIA